jgi:threonine aldolase
MTFSLDFASDNWAGVSPALLDAIAAANGGLAPAYGGDAVTARMAGRFRALFGCAVEALPVPTGTAANGLALELLAGRDGAVAGHEEAHIFTKEGPARAYFNDRGTMLRLPGVNGKIAPDALERALAGKPAGRRAAVSLTQGTDCGTLYTLAEVAALCAVAKRHGAATHMDGARFANAVATLGCDPADLTWRAGIDILSFGATKNGALGVDGLVIFNSDGAGAAWAKQAHAVADCFGYVASKSRFASVQLDAMLENGHWLDLARKANALAARLADGLTRLPGVRLAFPREINEIFAVLPAATDDALRAAGARYHPWQTKSAAADVAPRTGERLVRMICSFATEDASIDRLLAVAEGAPRSARAAG